MLATVATIVIMLLAMGFGAWSTLAGIVILLMLSRVGVLIGLAVTVIGLALFAGGAIGFGLVLLA